MRSRRDRDRLFSLTSVFPPSPGGGKPGGIVPRTALRVNTHMSPGQADRLHRHLLSNIDKLFSERIEVYSQLSPTHASVMATVVKIVLKVL